MSKVVLSDGTRYERRRTGQWIRLPAKPYRNKAERKVWKRKRQQAAGLY